MNQVDYRKFYSELGKLLYAVADIDKVISPKEKKALLDIVKQELVPAEINKDEFGTSAAHYAEIEFEFLEEQIIDSKTALESFLDFMDEHRTLIDEPMRKTCLKLTERLAAAYHGINSKERELLTAIRNKLTV